MTLANLSDQVDISARSRGDPTFEGADTLHSPAHCRDLELDFGAELGERERSAEAGRGGVQPAGGADWGSEQGWWWAGWHDG